MLYCIKAEMFVWNLILSFSSKELLDYFKCRTNVDLSSFSMHSYDPWTKFTTERTPFLWSWTKLLTDEFFYLYSRWRVLAMHKGVTRCIPSCPVYPYIGSRSRDDAYIPAHLQMRLTNVPTHPNVPLIPASCPQMYSTHP